MKITENDGKITVSSPVVLENSFLRDRIFTKIWNENAACENKYNEHPKFVKIPNDLYFAFSTEVFEHRGFPCGHRFFSIIDGEICAGKPENFCPDCGQHLDWSEICG